MSEKFDEEILKLYCSDRSKWTADELADNVTVCFAVYSINRGMSVNSLKHFNNIMSMEANRYDF